jgi:hypothetical protein
MKSSITDIITVNKSKMRPAGHVACMTDMINAYKLLIGRHCRMWDDNIKINVKEV